MATIYHSRVKGHRDPNWPAGCPRGVDGLSITNEANGEAVLAGPIIDRQPCLSSPSRCVTSACPSCVKRQMYGRAKINRLRKRGQHAA